MVVRRIVSNCRTRFAMGSVISRLGVEWIVITVPATHRTVSVGISKRELDHTRTVSEEEYEHGNDVDVHPLAAFERIEGGILHTAPLVFGSGGSADLSDVERAIRGGFLHQGTLTVKRTVRDWSVVGCFAPGRGRGI